MKTLTVIECKFCGAYIHGSDDKTVLHPWEVFDWIIRKIPKCTPCKERSDRTTNADRKRPRGPSGGTRSM